MVMDFRGIEEVIVSGYLIMNKHSRRPQPAPSKLKQTGRCTGIERVRTNAHAMDGRQKLGRAGFLRGSRHPFGVQP